MKLELTAKEVKGIGPQRVMEGLDKKYAPWVACGFVVLFAGVLTAIAGSEIGVFFIALGILSVLGVVSFELWEAHIEGYKFLDSVIKGDAEKEQ